jgi:flagellar biosynthesis GTPase FlhF
MESTSEDNSDKTKHIIKLIETLFNNGDEIDKERLIRKINKLSDEDKTFINDRAKTLIDIDNNMITTIKSSELITSLNKLQMNILTLFLMSRIPECSNDINLILKNFNNKIANVNEIIKYNLDDKNNTTSSDEDLQTSTSEGSQTPIRSSIDLQDKERQDKEPQDKELQEKEQQEKERQEKERQEKEQQEKKQQEKERQDKEPQDKELQDKERQDKEQIEILQKKIEKLQKENYEQSQSCSIVKRELPKQQTKSSQINTIDELYNYITAFNKDNGINSKSMSYDNINKSLIDKFLLGIDNTTFKKFVNEMIANKYTYKRLFGLPERIKYYYK